MVDTSHPDLTVEDVTKMKKLTLRKLGQVSYQIEQLLAGQDVTLVNMPLPGSPDEEWTKLIKLRVYKALLNDTLQRIADGPFGFCQVCDKPIAKLELQEMPWADVCSSCAAQGKTVIAKYKPE